MNGSTPISQLRPDMNHRASNPPINENMLSYQDVLKDMESNKAQATKIQQSSEQVEQISQPVNQIPPYPQYQSQQTPQQTQPIQIPQIANNQQQTNNMGFCGMMNPMQQKISSSSSYELLSDNVQQDIAIIVIGYIVLHSDQVQNLLKEKIPNMYSEMGKISTFGIIAHAIIIVIMLYAGKILKNKFEIM